VTRNLPALLETHVEGQTVRFAQLLELDFIGDFTRVWSGRGTLTALGEEWLGVGELGMMNGVGEPTDLTDQTMKATLNSIPEESMVDFVELLGNQNQTNRPFTFHLAFFNEDTSLIDVQTMTTGFISAVSFSDGEISNLTLELVSEASLLKRTQFYRTTDAMQKKLFPGDKFFEFVTELDDEILWGSTDKSNIGSGGIKRDVSSGPGSKPVAALR